MQLAKHGIIEGNHAIVCLFYWEAKEGIDQMMLLCPISGLLWQHVFSWLGIQFVATDSLLNHFSIFCSSLCQIPSICSCKILVAACWNRWLCKNSILFKDKIIRNRDIPGKIIWLSHEWFYVKFKSLTDLSWGIEILIWLLVWFRLWEFSFGFLFIFIFELSTTYVHS